MGLVIIIFFIYNSFFNIFINNKIIVRVMYRVERNYIYKRVLSILWFSVYGLFNELIIVYSLCYYY